MTSLGAHYPVYAVTKAGVGCFTRVSALELSPSGVRVNAVNPGPVRTNIINNCKLDDTYDDFGPKTTQKSVQNRRKLQKLSYTWQVLKQRVNQVVHML